MIIRINRYILTQLLKYLMKWSLQFSVFFHNNYKNICSAVKSLDCLSPIYFSFECIVGKMAAITGQFMLCIEFNHCKLKYTVEKTFTFYVSILFDLFNYCKIIILFTFDNYIFVFNLLLHSYTFNYFFDTIFKYDCKIT